MISSLNNTYADSTTSNVSVRVNGIDKLEISDGGTLTLDMASGSIALGPASDSTAVLSYVHNRVNNLKLSSEATIVNSPNPSNNDLILKISVQDGAGSRILYNDSGSTGPQDIVTGISAGPVSNKTVTYTAEGTANGTPIDEDIELSFTIMFTSLDE